jgi:hypothetical protein
MLSSDRLCLNTGRRPIGGGGEEEEEEYFYAVVFRCANYVIEYLFYL